MGLVAVQTGSRRQHGLYRTLGAGAAADPFVCGRIVFSVSFHSEANELHADFCCAVLVARRLLAGVTVAATMGGGSDVASRRRLVAIECDGTARHPRLCRKQPRRFGVSGCAP